MRHATTPLNDTARLYARYAIALVVLTLLAGVYLRAALTWTAARGTVHGPFMVHAHSHAGFFGWAVMGALAVVTARMTLSGAAALLHRGLAHAIGIGSVAAFAGFALRGYDTTTIALSAVHVALWAVFAAAVWQRVGGATAATRQWLRAGLAFLVLSGLVTTAPVVMMVRGTSDPWLLQLGVKLFLTPFVTGFLLLSAIGLLYEGVQVPRRATSALVLIAVGVLPSTLLYVPAVPPAAWLTWAGRAGIALVGAGTLLALADLLRGRMGTALPALPALPPLARLAIAAAAAKAVLEPLAAAGVGAAFMHSRAVTIAVLHLVLLGVVTPAFALGVRPGLVAPVRSAAYAAGVALMVASLGVTGWPWAARLLVLNGVPFAVLLALSFAGGALAAAALAALLVPDTAAREQLDAAGAPREPAGIT
jgi:hypothetical protein